MALEGSFVMEKTGPLPNWAWMGLGLGAAVAFASWQRNKKAGMEEEPGGPRAPVEVGDLPESLQPTYAFVAGDTILNQDFAPPVGGRPPNKPGPTQPAPKPETPAPKPPPKPKPKPSAPKGKWVTVAKWNATKAPWNSTIWGISNRLLGSKVPWQNVWNAPENRSLKSKRKDPTKIQPGDKVWVPGAK